MRNPFFSWLADLKLKQYLWIGLTLLLMNLRFFGTSCLPSEGEHSIRDESTFIKFFERAKKRSVKSNFQLKGKIKFLLRTYFSAEQRLKNLIRRSEPFPGNYRR